MKHVRGLTGLLVPLALLVQGAGAQGGAAAGRVQQPSKVMITTTDTAKQGEYTIILRQGSPRLDSLIRRLDGLPVGSPEFFATDSAIQVALRRMPAPALGGRGRGDMRVEFTTPRAVLRGSPMDIIPQGWFGFIAAAVNRPWYGQQGSYVEYFEYPTVLAIEANSPASRAGLQAGDSLMAYDGLDLRRQPINLTRLLTPGREVTVRYRRDGEARDALVAVEKAPPGVMVERRAEVAQFMAAAPEDRRFVEERAVAATRGTTSFPTPRPPVAAGAVGGGYRVGSATVTPAAASVNGVLGAAMTELDPGFATAIKGAEGKHGVVITKVPPGSLADRTGLRNGDIILRVGASDVATLAQLRVRLLDADQSGPEKVKLTILRGGKTQEIMYFTRER